MNLSHNYKYSPSDNVLILSTLGSVHTSLTQAMAQHSSQTQSGWYANVGGELQGSRISSPYPHWQEFAIQMNLPHSTAGKNRSMPVTGKYLYIPGTFISSY